MPIKYIPYNTEPARGQAILSSNILNRKREEGELLRWQGRGKELQRIRRGLPLFEVETVEKVGEQEIKNLVLHGDCLNAIAYMRENNLKVDLVYIDPPFASNANYSKKIYIRRNPDIQAKVQEVINKSKEDIDNDKEKSFEEIMYSDIWRKEDYLSWIYERLLAIKSVMSDTASIYVHLDWHIGHYVKIMLDEIFGEENFRNEIVWKKYSGVKNQASSKLTTQTDTIFWYSKNEDLIFNLQYRKMTTKYVDDEYKFTDENGRRYALLRGRNYKDNKETKKKYLDENAGSPVTSLWDDDNLQLNTSSSERDIGYATQKPEALLERIIKASSDQGMVVADFFGGSGVTAAVASKLGRRFITSDVNLNSIQTIRGRLRDNQTSFEVLRIKDGTEFVNQAFKNPSIADRLLSKNIVGLVKNSDLSDFWIGSVADSGLVVPVYFPKMKESFSKILTISFVRLLDDEITKIDNLKKVVVYYIDRLEEVDQCLKSKDGIILNNSGEKVEIEFRHVSEVVEDSYVPDDFKFVVDQKNQKIEITKFRSQYLFQKITGEHIFRFENGQGVLDFESDPNNSPSSKITISDNSLELIESVSLDCTNKDGVWQSDYEIKIHPKTSFVINNGVKTKEFWDGSINYAKKPLRVKVRSIAGDEVIKLI